MENLLVLTDFSEVASYAASYACVLARQLSVRRIILYHSCETVISPGGEGAVFIRNEENRQEMAREKLSVLAASLQKQVPEGVLIRCCTNDNLLEKINEVIIETGADMIVMGTRGKDRLEEIVAGSHVMRVCEVSDVPVILVPAQIPMQPAGGIVFACDLEEIKETLPGEEILQVLNAFQVPLSVVHVGEKGRLTNEEAVETKELQILLEAYHPEYHELNNNDTAEGILEFAGHQQNSIILLVARKHGFIAGLFHTNITKQLAFHSPVPLLVLREKDIVYPEMPLLEI